MKTFRYRIGMTVLVALALVVAGCASSSEEPAETAEAATIEVDLKTELAASPDDVWKIVGGFGGVGGVDWLAAVLEVSVEGEGVGAIRTFTIAGEEGGAITERLDALDDEVRSLTYTILESPLPIDNYTATMAVSVNDDGKTEFRWSSSFTAKGVSDDEAQIFVEHFYMGGFNDLKKALGEAEESSDEE